MTCDKTHDALYQNIWGVVLFVRDLYSEMHFSWGCLCVCESVCVCEGYLQSILVDFGPLSPALSYSVNIAPFLPLPSVPSPFCKRCFYKFF